MILTCPTCSTRFSLPAGRLSPEGRNVKCSNCSEVWFALPDPDDLIDDIEKKMDRIPESVRPVPEGSSVPVLREPEEGEGYDPKIKWLPSAAAAAMVFLLIMAALVGTRDSIVRAWPPSAAVYELIGMNVVPPGAGVEFDRVDVMLDSVGQLFIEGYLINLKSAGQALPAMSAEVKDSTGQTLEKWNFAPPADYIEKEASLPFQTTFPNIPAEAESIHLGFVLGGGVAVNIRDAEIPQNEAHEEDEELRHDDEAENPASQNEATHEEQPHDNHH